MTGERLSTGLSGLDEILLGLIPGDNIVWQVDSIESYAEFVAPLCRSAQEQGQKLTYFRFSHQPFLVPEGIPCEVHTLAPEDGFEAFITSIHMAIQANGESGFYVFDSLSELALDCYSDRMVGNFFMLTCPFLLKRKAIAYFAVLRHYHSFHASSPIAETTQLLIDVYRHKDKTYIHPRKVLGRFSQSIHMLHLREEDRFKPVSQSAIVSEVLASTPWPGLETPSYQVGVWNRVFFQAEMIYESLKKGECPPERAREIFRQLLRMAISRDERILALAERYLTFPDILALRRHMVGTGYLGGKSVGMLLARAILRSEDPTWVEKLEPHDSFYVASEVFYTYLILNDCWWIRREQRDPLKVPWTTEEAQRRIMQGHFPDYMIHRFENMLEYFGQSPIIVRSSSLLEDNYGNMFAGKYESVFCTNQGTREERLEQLMNAIRIVYASSMSQDALMYRAQHGVLDQDEQMALLVQRVSGAQYGDLYYPQVAGIGYSFNPYVWTRYIDPEAGVVRLVFGLGTRAVSAKDEDYTRLVALNAPHLRPEGTPNEIRKYTQRRVDTLNLETHEVQSLPFEETLQNSPGFPSDLFCVRDEELEQFSRDHHSYLAPTRLLSFDNLFNHTPLLKDLRRMLKSLQAAYHSPVDIEFTVNFLSGNEYKINLLQCRPFQVKGIGAAPTPRPEVSRERIIFEGSGAVIGTSRTIRIERLISIVPSVYGNLSQQDRYSVARLVGKLIHIDRERTPRRTLLMGPGRWGTTTPSLGVPVCFAEISRASVLCEMVMMRDGLVPEVSLGTHFFSNLIETDILYAALFPNRPGNWIHHELLEQLPNEFESLLPDEGRHADAIRVTTFDTTSTDEGLWVYADCLSQSVICFLGKYRPV